MNAKNSHPNEIQCGNVIIDLNGNETLIFISYFRIVIALVLRTHKKQTSKHGDIMFFFGFREAVFVNLI